MWRASKRTRRTELRDCAWAKHGGSKHSTGDWEKGGGGGRGQCARWAIVGPNLTSGYWATDQDFSIDRRTGEQSPLCFSPGRPADL